MTTQVKPGTRCECRDCGDSHNRRDTHRPCSHDAVRIVSVMPSGRILYDAESIVDFHTKRLCAPCAAYHEARQKESA